MRHAELVICGVTTFLFLISRTNAGLSADVNIAGLGALPDPPTELVPAVPVTAQLHPIEGSSFIASRQTIGQFASTIDGDHEDAGFLTNGGGPYGGAIATHIVYQNAEFSLQLPPGATDVQILFAPTTRPPNGSCLEMGTSYRTIPGQPTEVTVYVFDFCTGKKFATQIPVDDAFLSNYTFQTADGHRAYTVAITTNAPNPGISANWNAALANTKTKKWDTVYSTTGISNDARGWTIFETWFGKGQCSKSLPPLIASNIQYKNLTTSKWEEGGPNMPHMTINRHDGKSSDLTNTNCFNDDKTGLASYVYSVLKPYSSWQVNSTGH